ncbi:hypothetical protein [uncultured Brevundimonas sp.]|uniref:hypothetical protein n=1 Tax=uncultured Brevundimonas sp. TaxID=213418 RepID=UPI0030EC9879|tara:strand:- start:2929 stop:3306 length:378 start_codon:yes stop_codon:yes gene_type:complete
MSTRFKLDEGRKRIIVTVLPQPRTTTVADTVISLLEQRAEVGAWDWIFDIRVPHAKATPDELDRIAAAFNAVRSKQSYTIFVSDDPIAHERCRIMDTKFLDRRHLVASTMRAATALIPRTMAPVY